jgi:hypothetical protein
MDMIPGNELADEIARELERHERQGPDQCSCTSDSLAPDSWEHHVAAKIASALLGRGWRVTRNKHD